MLPVNDIERVASVGRRVVVTGMAGSGKSTFSRALSTRTGLPVIHLDVHFWKPGWVPTPEKEWREKQQWLLSGDEWIVDGNDATLDLRLERADTVVFLDTSRWICTRRALIRGLRKRPVNFELPDGCDESVWRRLRDEWSLAGRIWRDRGNERERDLRAVSKHGEHVALHVLGSRRAARGFLAHVEPRHL
jgi:adenylate kinase family enzyme